MPKILMPIGDGSEVLDTFYAYYRLPEDGFDVVLAGPENRLYHTVLHEIPPNSAVPWDITEERPGYHLHAEVAFRDLKAGDFAGAFISGGRAPEYIRFVKAHGIFGDSESPRTGDCQHLVRTIVAINLLIGLTDKQGQLVTKFLLVVATTYTNMRSAHVVDIRNVEEELQCVEVDVGVVVKGPLGVGQLLLASRIGGKAPPKSTRTLRLRVEIL